MNDMPRLEPISAGEARLAGRAAADRAALFKQFWTGPPMDRTIDAAAAEKRLVGCIDDRVDIECRDVGPDDLKDRHGVPNPR